MSIDTYSFDASASKGALTITCGGSHSPGSWGELVAATDYDADGFFLNIHLADVGIGVQEYLVDVYTGLPGFEVPLLSNLMVMSYRSIVEPNLKVHVPVSIPSGTRVIARGRTANTSRDLNLSLTIYDGAPVAFSTATTYGAVTASSRGTAVASSGTDNALGNWIELTDSGGGGLDQNEGMFLLNVNRKTGDACTMLMDIGTGAPASQVAVMESIPWSWDAHLAHVATPIFGPFALPLTAGTRVWAQIRASNNSPQTFYAQMIGLS